MKVCRLTFVLACIMILAAAVLAQQRLDSEIQAQIERRIGRLPGVTIAVQNGVVTVSGTVRSFAQRLNIVNMARRTVGVRQVVDQMTVVPARPQTDATLEDLVRQSLRDNLSNQEFDAITVRAQNGVIILTGTLTSSYPRQLAGTLTSLVPGVVDIRNEIVVRPPETRTDEALLADLRTRYERNPLVPHNLINVSVSNGFVTLTGTVNSFVQTEQAETVARFVPGVIEVRNLLFVQ